MLEFEVCLSYKDGPPYLAYCGGGTAADLACGYASYRTRPHRVGLQNPSPGDISRLNKRNSDGDAIVWPLQDSNLDTVSGFYSARNFRGRERHRLLRELGLT